MLVTLNIEVLNLSLGYTCLTFRQCKDLKAACPTPYTTRITSFNSGNYSKVEQLLAKYLQKLKQAIGDAKIIDLNKDRKLKSRQAADQELTCMILL